MDAAGCDKPMIRNACTCPCHLPDFAERVRKFGQRHTHGGVPVQNGSWIEDCPRCRLWRAALGRCCLHMPVIETGVNIEREVRCYG